MFEKQSIFCSLIGFAAILFLVGTQDILAQTSSTSAAAQNVKSSDRGRLPDGRPFRIDRASGLRLSDYIAELEVNNDDLHRQLTALEDELSEKRSQIEQYEKQTGMKLAPKIKETTLVEKSSLPPAKSGPMSCSPEDPQMVALLARVKELEAKLQSAPAPIPASVSAQGAPTDSCDFQSPKNPYREQVAVLQKALADSPSRDALQQERTQRLQLEEQLVQLKKLNEQQEANIEKLQEVASARVDLPTAESRARQVSGGQISVAQQPVAVGNAVAPPSYNTSEAPANDKADLVSSLNKLQTLVLERKNLYDNVKKTGRGITVSLQPLVTKQRVTLDDMRMNVQRFQPGQDANPLRTSLSELEKILQDDIEVLKRLSH